MPVKAPSMAAFFSDILQFVGDLMDHWVAFATGSVPVMVVGFWERWRGRPLSRRAYFALFLAFGLLAASFQTWRQEHSTSSRAATVAGLKKFYAESDGLFRECMGIKNADGYKAYEAKANDFSIRLEKWVTENMGPGANARLLRFSMPPNLGLKTAISQEHNSSIVAIMQIKENIAGLIENPVWDKP
jgi:hypothetical protein